MKFLKIIEISIQSQFEYKINYLINFIFSFIPFFTNILLWIAIFNNNENMFDYNYNSIVSYYFIILIVDNFINSKVVWSISNDIKNGDINKYLIKPFNYKLYNFLLDFPNRLNFIVLGFIPVCIVAFVLRSSLQLNLSAINISVFIISLFIEYVISFLINYLLSILSFFLSDVGSLFVAVNILKGLVTGSVFPLDMLPSYICQILICLPFSHMGYNQTLILQNQNSIGTLIFILVSGLFWIITLLVLSSLFWRLGLKKYSSFGG